MTNQPVLLLFSGFMLGLAIACLVAFFLNRFEVFNARVLGSVVSVIAGGIVTAFLGPGKDWAWCGYCIGLGAPLAWFVFVGRLDINVARDVAKEVEQPQVRDSRLKMLDELNRRYRDSVINMFEFERLKASILADIELRPGISEPQPAQAEAESSSIK